MNLEKNNNIVNPLTEPNVMNQLISAYAKPGDFYTRVMQIGESKSKGQINEKDLDSLYSLLFNNWKKGILSMSPKEIEEGIKNRDYDKSIYKLIDLLKKTADIKSLSEANKVLNHNYQDKELCQAISKYRWDKIGSFSNELYISSQYVNVNKSQRQNIEHALYINPSSEDTYKFAKIYIEKCIEENLPYSLKVVTEDDKTKGIVIYSDNKDIKKQFDLLLKLGEENPEIIKKAGKAPLLTTKVSNWVGYGYKPLSKTGTDIYNRVKANKVEKAIFEETMSWIHKNKNLQVTIDNKNVSLYDYLSSQLVKKELKIMRKRLGQEEYSINENSKKLGYTKEDLSNKAFQNKLLIEVGKILPNIIESSQNGSQNMPEIEFLLRDGKKYKIYDYRVEEIIKSFVSTIAKYDKGFTKRVISRIGQQPKSPKQVTPKEPIISKENIQKKVTQAKKQPEPEKTPIKEPEIPKFRPIPTEEQLYARVSKMAELLDCEPLRKRGEDESELEYGKYIREYYKNVLESADQKRKQRNYIPMSDDEIRLAQSKLGFDNKETYQPKKTQPVKEKYVYRQMTDEEISESRKKLGFDKQSSNTTQQRRSTKTYIYTYKPMTDEEIMKARETIGEYKAPKVKTR